MSTKKIREALSVPPDVELLEAADLELVAIHKAAKALSSDEVRLALRHALEDIHEALALMVAISKEATWVR